MSIKGWILIGVLLGSAVLAKPMVDSGWGQDPAYEPMSGDGNVASDRSAASDGTVTDDRSTTEAAPPSLAEPAPYSQPGATSTASETDGAEAVQPDVLPPVDPSSDVAAPDTSRGEQSQGSDRAERLQDGQGGEAHDNTTQVTPASSTSEQRETPVERETAVPVETTSRPEDAPSSPKDYSTQSNPDEAKTTPDTVPTGAVVPNTVTPPPEGVDDGRRAAELAAADSAEKLKTEQQKTQDLVAKLTEAQGALGTLRDELSAAQAQSADLQKSAEQAKAAASAAQEDVTKVRAEAAEVSGRRDDDSHAAAARVDALQHQLDGEQARTAGLESNLQSARAELADSNRQRLAASDEKAASAARIKILEGQLEGEQKKSAALAEQLASAQAMVRKLQEDAKKVQANADQAGPVQAAGHPKRSEGREPQASLERPELRSGPANRPTASPAARTRAAAIPAEAPRFASRPTQPNTRKAALAPASRPASSDTGSRPGEAGDRVASVPASRVTEPEGFTSDDYSPYDTSDHTVYIDDVVTEPAHRMRLGACRTRACATARDIVRVAKGSQVIR